jgi:TetR/AcrR family tetracycline transcriptional repressor
MAARKKDAEPLTRERIIEAAMRVIDADGVDALSMRRLGTELGVNPMAAYHYVPNKAALYDLVLDAVMSGVDLTAVGDAVPVEERLKQAGRAYRNAILAHPRAIPIVAGRSIRTAASLRPIEPLVGLLFEAGLDPVEAISAVDCVAQFVLGGAIGYYHHMVDSEMHQRAFEELSPEDFPNMTRVLSEAHFIGPDGEFEFGLDVIVRGLLSAPRSTT